MVAYGSNNGYWSAHLLQHSELMASSMRRTTQAMICRLLVGILAHVVGSYCAVGFWTVDNYGADIAVAQPFGNWYAPIYVPSDYTRYTLQWKTLNPDEKHIIMMYWSLT
jgi:hypothetical protein